MQPKTVNGAVNMSKNEEDMAGSSSIDGFVTINVGGKEFATLLSTLKKADTISKFIGGEKIRNMVKPKDGTIFVDRDTKHFPLILNVLRDIDFFRRERRMCSLPTDEIELSEIELEAKFYGIDELVAYCKNILLNKEVAAGSSNIDGFVTINVGGTTFSTLLTTLKKASTIAKFIGGEKIRNMAKLEDETIFVDRDAKHFPLILNFLRDTVFFQRERMVSIPTDEIELSELELEAKFYGIRELVAYCKDPLLNKPHVRRR